MSRDAQMDSEQLIRDWASTLSPVARDAVLELATEPIEDTPRILLAAIDKHLAVGRERQALGLAYDEARCEELARQCRKLVARIPKLTPAHQRVALIAVHYFCMRDDAESDFDSDTGFLDDELVISSALGVIGPE